MVCFIDDDLVCESYSLSEEIYLLRNHEQDSHPATRTTASSSSVCIPSTVPPMLNPERSTSNTNNLGVVLDLHANSEASGSRFENPKWFLHLPSLKPIGMNAMLAYKNSVSLRTKQLTTSNVSLLPSTTTTFKSGKHSSGTSSSINNSTVPMKPSSKEEDHIKHHAYTYAHPPSKKSDYPSLPSFIAPVATRSESENDSGRSSCNVSVVDPPFHITTSQRNAIEKTLIKHSKSQFPLECLRELSEEIGFEESDVEHLQSILDVSVLAPGLGDIRQVEDTHSWSQEQTRKRGSFEPHIVGNIVEDCRQGSLQLMAHGTYITGLTYLYFIFMGYTLTCYYLSFCLFFFCISCVCVCVCVCVCE